MPAPAPAPAPAPSPAFAPAASKPGVELATDPSVPFSAMKIKELKQWLVVYGLPPNKFFVLSTSGANIGSSLHR